MGVNKRFSSALLSSALLLITAASAPGKQKTSAKSATGDEIEVIAHISLPSPSSGPLKLKTADHLRRDYLYIEHTTEQMATVVDVTSPNKPRIMEELTYPKTGQPLQLSSIEGETVLLVSSGAGGCSPGASVTVVNFRQPDNPRIARQFHGVTGLLEDRARGLVYVTNTEGLWILQKQSAPDRAVEQQYERDLLYNH